MALGPPKLRFDAWLDGRPGKEHRQTRSSCWWVSFLFLLCLLTPLCCNLRYNGGPDLWKLIAFKLRAGLNMDSPISLPHLTTGSTTTPVAPKAPAAVLPPTSTPGNTKAASAAIKTGSTTKPTEEQPSAAPNKEVAKASTKKELTQDASLLPLAIPVEASPQVVPAKVMTSDLPKKANALPSFVVNDESKITVSLVSHELQESMARNSFSSTSFEGEV